MQPKSLTRSKTFWVNFVVILVAALIGVSNAEVIKEFPVIVPWITGLIAALNIVLRLVTKTPIKQ